MLRMYVYCVWKCTYLCVLRLNSGLYLELSSRGTRLSFQEIVGGGGQAWMQKKWQEAREGWMPSYPHSKCTPEIKAPCSLLLHWVTNYTDLLYIIALTVIACASVQFLFCCLLLCSLSGGVWQGCGSQCGCRPETQSSCEWSALSMWHYSVCMYAIYNLYVCMHICMYSI